MLSIRKLQSAINGPFDLDIAKGECVTIVGESGVGKSLFMRLIADLDPGTGSVSLDGLAREDWPPTQWRRKVVYQAAEPAWWAPVVASHFPVESLDATRASLPALSLPADILDAEVSRLSTGERQRLALLRSLARDPVVLLLDEPTASLDSASALAMEALLQARRTAGLAILWVTHSSEQALRMGQRRFEMTRAGLHPS